MNSEKKKLVMVFGTFDYLHAGHENLFSQAKEHGDEIIAVVARDKTVQAIKGEAPDHNEKERTKNLNDTGWAAKVVLGNAKDKNKVIKMYRPDVIALGYDQFAFTYGLEKLAIDLKLDTQILRLKPYRPDMYKSSIIKNSKKNQEEVAQEKKLVYNLEQS
ncbi:adenylyltransferase/cytidyltransferase family protein [Candidatus Peregrinibacteria bacterium]|jgi:FAD synthetase|nr:adenylyltransferase/cytidyltransferase family protein [Candidatus Peregrinibacteria bacterium]